VLLIAVLSACNLPVPGDAGNLSIATRTTGGDFDLDGYIVIVDGEHEYPAPANGQIVVEDLRDGDHVVELRGIAANCEAEGPVSREVEVDAGDFTRTVFDVHCYVTGITVATAVDGLDLDRAFNIFVDDQEREEVALLNAVQKVTRLAPGTHAVRLGDIASNCHLDPASHTVVVKPHTVTPVQFTGKCVALFGSVLVRVNTSGEDRDLSGYAAAVSGAGMVRGSGSGFVLDSVAPGTRDVQLSAVAPNCTVSGPNPKPVVVTAGRAVRDTVISEFDVICSRLWGLALIRSGSLALATADATTLDILPGGAGRPAWSPDGVRLAYPCGTICVADLETGQVDRLNYIASSDVSWRPDGERIVFGEGVCDYYGYYCTSIGLAMTSPSGQGRTPIPLPARVTWVSSPAWSPDGSRIAFGCRVDTVVEDKICVVRPDGTDFRQLTTGPGNDFSPAWNPDGLRIAFMTTRFGDPEIVVMDAAGTAVTRLNPAALGTHPAWTPDGSRILYRSGLTGRPGLTLVNADGSGAVQLTATSGDGPAAWRP
jgi:hypothetical protein